MSRCWTFYKPSYIVTCHAALHDRLVYVCDKTTPFTWIWDRQTYSLVCSKMPHLVLHWWDGFEQDRLMEIDKTHNWTVHHEYHALAAPTFFFFNSATPPLLNFLNEQLKQSLAAKTMTNACGPRAWEVIALRLAMLLEGTVSIQQNHQMGGLGWWNFDQIKLPESTFLL